MVDEIVSAIFVFLILPILSNLANWSTESNMKFNADKSKVLTISSKKTPALFSYHLGADNLVRVLKEKGSWHWGYKWSLMETPHQWYSKKTARITETNLPFTWWIYNQAYHCCTFPWSSANFPMSHRCGLLFMSRKNPKSKAYEPRRATRRILKTSVLTNL